MNRLLHPLVRIPARYGLLGVFLQGLLFLILYFMGENPLVIGRPWDFGFLLIPIVVFFGMKDFKVNYNEGELRFWQGMTSGFITYGLLAFGSALFIYLFLTLADPAVLQGYIDDRLQLLMEKRQQFVETLGEDLYRQQLVKMKETTAGIVALDDFWKKLSIGLFLTILIAVILRK